MEKSAHVVQRFAPRRAGPHQALAASRLLPCYPALLKKQLLTSRLYSSYVTPSVYYVSQPLNYAQCSRSHWCFHTDMGRRGDCTWRYGCEAYKRNTKDKFLAEHSTRGVAYARTLRAAAVHTTVAGAADKGDSKKQENVAQDIDARVHDEGRAPGDDQADGARPKTDLLLQKEQETETKAGAPPGKAEKEPEFRIVVKTTPNPLARQFCLLGVPLLPPAAGSLTSKGFSKRDKYDHIPFIKSLFETADCTSILVAKEYLTVVKKKADVWEDLEQKVRTCLLRHLRAGAFPLEEVISSDTGTPQPSVSAPQQPAEGAGAVASRSDDDSVSTGAKDAAPTAHTEGGDAPVKSSTENHEDDEDVSEAIKSLLYTRARPMLLADGGDLELIRFDPESGIVWVYLKGSCQGCPSSIITVKRGMKQMLQYYIPEVEDVRQCDENGEPLEEEDD